MVQGKSKILLHIAAIFQDIPDFTKFQSIKLIPEIWVFACCINLLNVTRLSEIFRDVDMYLTGLLQREL